MTFIQPLDLQLLFVNTFAGSMDIFMFIAFICIAGLAAMFRMPNMIAMAMFAVFGVFMANYSTDFYFLVVLFAGIAIFYGLKSVIER